MPRDDMAKAYEKRNPLGRTGEHRELADLAAYLVSDKSGFINGEVVTIDGGAWLAGAGQFSFASMLTDADWESLRPKKKYCRGGLGFPGAANLPLDSRRDLDYIPIN